MLGLEVIEPTARMHASGCGDVAHGGIAIALFAKEPRGLFDQGAAQPLVGVLRRAAALPGRRGGCGFDADWIWPRTLGHRVTLMLIRMPARYCKWSASARRQCRFAHIDIQAPGQPGGARRYLYVIYKISMNAGAAADAALPARCRRPPVHPDPPRCSIPPCSAACLSPSTIRHMAPAGPARPPRRCRRAATRWALRLSAMRCCSCPMAWMPARRCRCW
ncbi:hypothetical protein D3C72_1486230 [compost metagenome]